MDIWEQQAHIEALLAHRLIHDVDAHSLDDDLVLNGRRCDRAKGRYDRILDAVQKATDYDSLWATLASESLLWPPTPE